MLQIRQAQPTDLNAIAEVFVAAFAQSIEHSGAGPGAALALADIFGLALRAEPGSLIVAESEGAIAGYILAPSDVGKLRKTALRQGRWLGVLWRFLTGRYGVSLRTLRTVIADKVSFQSGMQMHTEYQARILSVGVSPVFQGQGIGRAIISAGLEYLRGQGVNGVRLEVRPDNAPAVHLYESFGFRRRGEYSDSQGQWLVMICDDREVAAGD
jgi:[ribosomal protein S18]-alanine N-acetyltransferase